MELLFLTFDTGAACVVEDVPPDELLFCIQKVGEKSFEAKQNVKIVKRNKQKGLHFNQ